MPGTVPGTQRVPHTLAVSGAELWSSRPRCRPSREHTPLPRVSPGRAVETVFTSKGCVRLREVFPQLTASISHTLAQSSENEK